MVFVIQVSQEACPPTNQLEQATPRRKILLVNLQVLRQLNNAPRQKGHLNLRRTGVLVMRSIGRHRLLFDLGFHDSELRLEALTDLQNQTIANPW